MKVEGNGVGRTERGMRWGDEKFIQKVLLCPAIILIDWIHTIGVIHRQMRRVQRVDHILLQPNDRRSSSEGTT